MKIKKTDNTVVLFLIDIERLDPITVFLQDFITGCGRITIICYDKVWSAYWGGMGERQIIQFFLSCDEHYIIKNLSDIDSEVFDRDAIESDAEEMGYASCGRDDPWNDYELMAKVYGSDMSDWNHRIPKSPNYEYQYLTRIVKAVQEGLKEFQTTG